MKIQVRAIITFISFLMTFLFVLWEQCHGGVVVHNILANDNLPGISNWWGLLTIPLLTWGTLFLVSKDTKSHSNFDYANSLLNFSVALVFGIGLSILWEMRLESIMEYVILVPVILSLIVKVHRPENLLGFVSGMIYTFGGVLPIGIGLLLLLFSYITYIVFNRGGRIIYRKIKSK